MKSEEGGVRGEESISVAAGLGFIRLSPLASLLTA